MYHDNRPDQLNSTFATDQLSLEEAMQLNSTFTNTYQSGFSLSCLNENSFLSKLWRMLGEVSHEEMIAWQGCGSKFEIKKQERIAKEVLPQYFCHGNFSSFQRQLNNFNFRKVGRGQEGPIYRHEFFNRNQPELALKIRRRKPPKKDDALTSIDAGRSLAYVMGSESTCLGNAQVIVWSKDEDEILRSWVSEHGVRGVKKAAKLLGRRSASDCTRRWQSLTNPCMNRRICWSKDEDDNLARAVGLVPSTHTARWSIVASHIPWRAAKQCRERWFHHLQPGICKLPWKCAEEAIIIAEQKKVGNHWATIAAVLPGRTDNQVKNHWNANLRFRHAGGRRQVDKMGRDDASRSRPRHEDSSKPKCRDHNHTCGKRKVRTLPSPTLSPKRARVCPSMSPKETPSSFGKLVPVPHKSKSPLLDLTNKAPKVDLFDSQINDSNIDDILQGAINAMPEITSLPSLSHIDFADELAEASALLETEQLSDALLLEDLEDLSADYKLCDDTDFSQSLSSMSPLALGEQWPFSFL